MTLDFTFQLDILLNLMLYYFIDIWLIWRKNPFEQVESSEVSAREPWKKSLQKTSVGQNTFILKVDLLSQEK